MTDGAGGHPMQRVRPVVGALAAAVVGFVTWTMLSDWPAQSGVGDDGLPLLPDVVAEPIQDARAGWGDADAHVVLWAIAASVVAAAVPRRRDRMWVYVALAAWSVVVELLQPVVTDLRALQWVDGAAGLAGIGLVAVADQVVTRRRSRHDTSARG